MTAWIRATRNHQGMPFAVIDKKAAMLHVFDVAGRPLGASRVLLGLAVGDDSVPDMARASWPMAWRSAQFPEPRLASLVRLR